MNGPLGLRDFCVKSRPEDGDLMSYDVDDWLAHPEVQALLDRAETCSREVYAASGNPPARFIVTEEEYRLLQWLRAPSSVTVSAEMLSQVEAVPIYLFGMRVCRPVRIPWYRDSHNMEHFDLLHPSNLSHLRPTIPRELVLGPCVTEHPHMRQPDVTCPCGQVIWDLSTSTRLDTHALGVPEAWHDLVSMRLPDFQTICVGREIPDSLPGLVAWLHAEASRMVQEPPAQMSVVPPSATFRGDDRTRHEQWRAEYTRWFGEFVASTPLRRDDTREVMETPDSALPDETLTCCGTTWPTHKKWMQHYQKVHG
jgi:hypothetical protein